MYKYLRKMHLWRRSAQRALQKHSGPLLLLATLFVIGVVFGALAVRSLSPADQVELAAYLDRSMVGLADPPAGAAAALVRQSFWANLKLVAGLWVLGISLVGLFGVMVGAFVRGMASGFAVAFFTAQMGSKGVLLALLGHLPQSLIEVPALLMAGAASVAFSLQVIQSWRERRRVPNFYPALGAYTGMLLLMGLALMLAGVVESYLSPRLVQMAVAYLKLG